MNAPQHEPHVCTLLSAAGATALSAVWYAALMPQSFDFFLDTTVTVERGGYAGRRSHPQAEPETCVLTPSEAAVIVQLVSARVALRAGDFDGVAVLHVDKAVERARQKLDVRLGRYRWRSIHTLRGDARTTKRYQFNPPADLTWGVVVPLIRSSE
jgi:hypothetical protein